MKLKMICALVFNFLAFFCNAQILKAGGIHAKHLSNSSFEITATIGIEWPVTINKPYVKINWGDGSPLDSLFYSGSFCTMHSSTTLSYVGTHTFPINGLFTISITDSFFVPGIYNIPNSSNENLYIHSDINTNFLPNSTAYTSFGCLNDSVECCNSGVYNAGCYDTDGDSISYALSTPPLISNYIIPPVFIDPLSGTLTFTANPMGLTSVTMRIDEWRKINNIYNLVSSSYKELFFEVTNSVRVKEYTNHISEFSVSPNPTSSTLNISDEQNQFQNSTIGIKNTLGQTILSLPFNTKVDVSSLPNGIYVLQIKTEDKKLLNTKFIKN